MYCFQSCATSLLRQCLRHRPSAHTYRGPLWVVDRGTPRSPSSRSDKPSTSFRDVVRGGLWPVLDDVRQIQRLSADEGLTCYNTGQEPVKVRDIRRLLSARPPLHQIARSVRVVNTVREQFLGCARCGTLSQVLAREFTDQGGRRQRHRLGGIVMAGSDVSVDLPRL